MLNTRDILETIRMIREENLDIRTVTMGISLFDCITDDPARTEQKIYDKITMAAKDLVRVCEDLESTYGIPIVNKRVSVTPISYIGAGFSPDGFVRLAKALDRAAKELGVNFIGGYSALVQKGATKGAAALIESIPEALCETERVCSSVNVASTKAGINMDAVRKMGEIVKQTAYLTRDNDSIGCAKLVVFANIPEDNPFMAGAMHGIGEPDSVINVGVSGPGVVAAAIKEAGACDFSALAETVKKIAFKITRVGQLRRIEVVHHSTVNLEVLGLGNSLRACKPTAVIHNADRTDQQSNNDQNCSNRYEDTRTGYLGVLFCLNVFTCVSRFVHGSFNSASVSFSHVRVTSV